MANGRVLFSDSTWQQPVPDGMSEARASIVSAVADRVHARLPGRALVGIDGRTGAGKTSFGHELAEFLAARGATVLRATMDDFKRPWRERHLYDRESGAGYYRNAFDYDALISLLLDPFRHRASEVALCAIDPITQLDHSATRVDVQATAVLVVDGVFAFRAEVDLYWTLRVWLEVGTERSTARGIARDAARADGETETLHRDRYGAAEAIYLTEVNPLSRADVVINNNDLAAPLILKG